jgi:hypothetical protein
VLLGGLALACGGEGGLQGADVRLGHDDLCGEAVTVRSIPGFCPA